MTVAEPLHSDKGTRLRQVVAEFFEVDEGEVDSAFSLHGRRGQGSIARAVLDSLIRRRIGVTSRLVYSARTYGELEAELVPGVAASTPTIPAVRDAADQGDFLAPAAGGVRCGIDIELISQLPHAADCWEDPFYCDHFAPAEIAYCLLQEMPALHFAARWCAKEALKKCDAAFLTTALKDIEVRADGMGAPYLVHHTDGGVRRLPHAVSLSHTPHAAVGVVVKVDASPAIPISPARNLSPTPAAPPPAPRRSGGSLVPTLLSLIALGVAIGALARTFWISR